MVLKGTASFAWCRWLITWWSAIYSKAYSAHQISLINNFQWCGSRLSKYGGASKTSRLFLDTWTPTQLYITRFPSSQKMHLWSLLTNDDFFSFSHASRAPTIDFIPCCPMMEMDLDQGRRMNGNTLLIRAHVNPMLGLQSSGMWRYWPWSIKIRRQLIWDNSRY